MSLGPFAGYPLRVYPLSPQELTQEQMAVTFAMTSRSPEPFDEIAAQVSQERAADFHERWVLGYGHASVAEHAVLHMAVENLSRLACDSLEDNRLASYTEKSSRYQVLPQGYYHVPRTLDAHPHLRELYINTCDYLFQAYEEMIDGVMKHLGRTKPRSEGERDSAYTLRLRREATDNCRFLLPAATLTNVGVTMNARALEHAITKLLSSDLPEERELGEDLKIKGREITPTLIKYADVNDYLVKTRDAQARRSSGLEDEAPAEMDGPLPEVRLVHHDPQAEQKLAAALLYRYSGLPYQEVRDRVNAMGPEGRRGIIADCMEALGEHDAPVRELEMVDYTFEFIMDYGAYREFKRHRMQTYIPQPLTVADGYVAPELVREAGLAPQYDQAMERSAGAFQRVQREVPQAAQYLVTHAHKRRFLSRMDLRECYHLFKLRTQPQAHFSIRGPVEQALRLAAEAHPHLFRFLKLRKYPDWWGELYPSP